MTARIWSEPDGTVKITRVVSGSLEAAAAILIEDGHINPTATFVDVPEAELLSLLPSDRLDRSKWRYRGGKVMVDHAIPDPPDPDQDILDAIQTANTVPELKNVLRRVLIRARKGK